MNTKLKRALLSIPIAYMLTLIESWLMFGLFLPSARGMLSFYYLRPSVFFAYWVLCFILLSIIQLIRVGVHRFKDRRFYHTNKSPQSIDETLPGKGELNPDDYRGYFLKKAFMNGGEIKFYDLLYENLHNSDLTIFTQVAYSALIYNKKDWMRRKFNSYYVDYVICNKDFVPVCAIELDGAYHREEHIQQRDAKKDLFWEAMEHNGIKGEYIFKFFRIPYDSQIEELKDVFRYLLNLTGTPLCETCGKTMAVRFNEKNRQFFLGCLQRDENGNFVHKTRTLFPAYTKI